MAALGCSGLIYEDFHMADHGGSFKWRVDWRVDLGAASLEGVHPKNALHQGMVNAAIIKPSLFPAR